MNQSVSKTSESSCQTIEDNYYSCQKGYKLIDHQDYFRDCFEIELKK